MLNVAKEDIMYEICIQQRRENFYRYIRWLNFEKS